MLEDINKKLPDYLPPRVALLKIACAEQQKEDCAARVQNILAQDPVNFEAVYQDALISASKGDTSKAIRQLEFLSNSFPRNALVRYQLASAYLLSAINASEVNARNATESAENRLSDAIKLDPKLEPAVLLFAELKIRKGSAAGNRTIARIDQGTTADRSGILSAGDSSYGAGADHRSSVNVSADGGAISKRSAAAISLGQRAARTRSASRSPKGIRTISRDFSRLPACH